MITFTEHEKDPGFRQRAAALEPKLRAKIARNETIILGEIAAELGVSLDVADVWIALLAVRMGAASAQHDAAAGEEAEVTLTGAWELPKASGQINEGAAVGWSTTDHNVKNATGAGLYPIGVAVRGAGSSDTTVRVRLSGVPVAAVGG